MGRSYKVPELPDDNNWMQVGTVIWHPKIEILGQIYSPNRVCEIIQKDSRCKVAEDLSATIIVEDENGEEFPLNKSEFGISWFTLIHVEWCRKIMKKRGYQQAYKDICNYDSNFSGLCKMIIKADNPEEWLKL